MALAWRLGAWSFVIPLVFFVGRGRRFALGGGAAMVLSEEPVKDLDSRGRGDRPARHLPVGVEAVVEFHVAPAVSVHDRAVELDVDLAQPGHVGINVVGESRGR